MQGNDIRSYADKGQGVIFEGLLAAPREKKFQLFRNRVITDWSKELQTWRANELPLKALIDTSDRLGVNTEIYTFLDPEAPDAIDKWLLRKGISLPVWYYTNVEELAYDLRFNRSIRTIFVPDQEQASVIGIRATVVDPKKAWTL